MRLDGKTDQGNKGGDSGRRSGKWLKVVEVTKLEVSVPDRLIVPLSGS